MKTMFEKSKTPPNPGSGVGAAPPTPGDAGDQIRGEAWERDLVNRLAFAAINEQRRARRWSVFFRFLLLLYLAVLIIPLYLDADSELSIGKEHTALVKLDGAISDDGEASADNLIAALRKAFKDDKTKGVILRINSPGGSAVQSSLINSEITRLRDKYPDIPLYAVITDMCASGGYFVAVAADKIYADRASLVGSIGVRMDSFGFVDAMEKLGIERRLMTAGPHKGMLDPFSPQKPDEIAHINGLLENVYQQFIDVVKAGRGERLKSHPDLFTGYVWSGEQALEMGMIDGFGSTESVARDQIGVEEVVEYSVDGPLLARLLKGVGLSLREGLVGAASEIGLR